MHLDFPPRETTFVTPPPPQPLFTALEASSEKGSTQKESIHPFMENVLLLTSLCSRQISEYTICEP